MPAAGEGISASTLSVEISNSGSSRWTLSPVFFSHLVIVPSTMDSPIWGMMMSVGMISFHKSPRFEAQARRKQFIIYKRELEAGTRVGHLLVGNDLGRGRFHTNRLK